MALLAALGVGLARVVTLLTGRPLEEPAIAIGYVFALIGWVLGVGLWGVWARDWLGLGTREYESEGWSRYFTFSIDHKVIGIQYLVTFMVVFLLAGLLSVLIRIELLGPGETIIGAKDFNTTMSLHGIMMVAVAVATIMGGFANFALPVEISS